MSACKCTPVAPYQVSETARTNAKELLSAIVKLGPNSMAVDIETLAMLGAALSEHAAQAMLLTKVDGRKVISDFDACREACRQAGLEILLRPTI